MTPHPWPKPTEVTRAEFDVLVDEICALSEIVKQSADVAVRLAQANDALRDDVRAVAGFCEQVLLAWAHGTIIDFTKVDANVGAKLRRIAEGQP